MYYDDSTKPATATHDMHPTNPLQAYMPQTQTGKNCYRGRIDKSLSISCQLSGNEA